MQCPWLEAFRFVRGNIVIESLAQNIIHVLFFLLLRCGQVNSFGTHDHETKEEGQVHLKLLTI